MPQGAVSHLTQVGNFDRAPDATELYSADATCGLRPRAAALLWDSCPFKQVFHQTVQTGGNNNKLSQKVSSLIKQDRFDYSSIIKSNRCSDTKLIECMVEICHL